MERLVTGTEVLYYEGNGIRDRGVSLQVRNILRQLETYSLVSIALQYHSSL